MPRNYYGGDSTKRSTYAQSASAYTGYPRRKKFYRGGKRSGPYGALSNIGRHTNPVYPKPESKFIDVNVDGTASGATPVNATLVDTGGVNILNALAAGSGQSSRIGNNVSTKSVTYKFRLVLGATPVACNGRVVLLWDKQTNATAVTFVQIFSQTNYQSFLIPGAKERFTVLRNTQFSLSPNGDQTLLFEDHVKINMASFYPQDASSTPTSGSLLVAFVSDQTVAAQQPIMQGTWRIRFLDT